MRAGGFHVSLAPKDFGSPVTGPMIAALLLIVGGIVARFSGLDRRGLVLCYFKALTGYACFTCGSTRAVGHLAHFDVPAAFLVQPLVTVAALALFVWGTVDALLLLAGKRTHVRLEGATGRWAFAALVFFAALNWIYLLASGV